MPLVPKQPLSSCFLSLPFFVSVYNFSSYTLPTALGLPRPVLTSKRQWRLRCCLLSAIKTALPNPLSIPLSILREYYHLRCRTPTLNPYTVHMLTSRLQRLDILQLSHNHLQQIPPVRPRFSYVTQSFFSSAMTLSLTFRQISVSPSVISGLTESNVMQRQF